MGKSRKIDIEIVNEYKSVKTIQLKAIISIMVRTVLNLYIIFSIQKLVDYIVKKEDTMNNKEIIILIFLVISYSACIYLSQYLLRLLFFTGNYALNNFLFKSILEKSVLYFEKNSLGEIISKITSDSILISDWMSQGKVMLVTQIFILISSVTVLIYYSYEIAIILSVLLFVCFFLIHKISQTMSTLTKYDQELKGRIFQKMTQSVSGIYDVKQFSMEKYFSKEIEVDLFQKRLPVSKKIALYFSLYVGTSAFVAMVLPLLALLLASYLASLNLISVGSIIAIYSVSRMLDEPIRVIADQISSKNLAIKTQERIKDIYQEKSTSNFKNQERDIPKFNSMKLAIKEYKYSDTSNPVIKNLDMLISKGELVVIKGPSGSGKSTIGNLLMNQISREYLIGDVLWNGEEIENFYEKLYYQKANKMDQNVFLFEGTIKQNLTLFKEYSEKELLEIVRLVGLDILINEKGWNYLIENNGGNISGGQKQRISLARVLLRKPEFLILDEPTSSLNKDLSTNIALRVTSYLKRNDLTTIVITHKDEFDEYSDKIVTFE